VTLFTLGTIRDDMAHVNKLRSVALRVAAVAVNSVKTQSCVRYDSFVGYCVI